ncbi:hypothetical protein F8B43_3704 [Methylorubrum populi]|uniref:Uncharacterized protein n=1 Tax=Methylorubrum populi TaxID=223967 RepID=A0A833J5Q9_9HYPH|nr:hypothetical protein F8B43_3704 [Methylorubrum populi]
MRSDLEQFELIEVLVNSIVSLPQIIAAEKPSVKGMIEPFFSRSRKPFLRRAEIGRRSFSLNTIRF